MSDIDDRTQALTAIIRPLRTAAYEVDSQWRDFQDFIQKLGHDYGGLELSPDYQRGHVWTWAQQQHFVENTLRGVIASSGFLVQFNCPNWDNDQYAGDLPRGLQCLDGLQRITAVQAFLEGSVRPFGLHVDDLNDSSFSIRRHRFRWRIAVHNFERRTDLLQHYLDLNAGGTPHSPAEVERVRALLAAASQEAATVKPKSSCRPGR